MRIIIIALTFLTLASIGFAQRPSVPEKKEAVAATPLEESEALARQYFDSFRKSGVPTAQTVKAAVERAKQQDTIEVWNDAAGIANTYANVVDVLTHHYSALYYASRSGSGSGNYGYLTKAADYEKIRNRYLRIRNDAYLQLAKLYSAKGDKAQALSYVVTAVKLSGAEPNAEGEALIRQYIELSE